MSFLNQHKISFVTPFNANYPRLLKEIYDYPFVLFYQGDPIINIPNTLVWWAQEMQRVPKAMQYLFPKFKQIPLTIISVWQKVR